ncbi:MAG: cytochrome b/b6 domain-containing protein [Desertifilum sp.]|nr:cytochrome b/b6 domain-containing protein [Desertifilum sp.]
MPKSPYQPLVLRILHGFNALIAILAILTSFWVYNIYDGRFGRLPLPEISGTIDLHGTLGLIFLLGFPAFGIYSVWVGNKRLVQQSTGKNLGRLNHPIGWYSWHRLINTAMLLAAIFALITGKMMQESWLPAGDLNQPWYQFHLLAWVVLVCCLALHIGLSLKVGGIPLVLSMVSWKYKSQDAPQNWSSQLRRWWQRN